MSAIPKPIHDAAATFDALPGVGPRAALRYAYWLAAQPKEQIRKFARALEGIADGISRCTVCGMWSDGAVCAICSDPKRDRSQICVVGTSQDVRVIEDSGAYRGTYHVLGGLLDPVEGRTPETLNIASLLRRVRENQIPLRELILAVDPDVSGDMTALYLTKQFSQASFPVTRIARGLQYGAQIEYADGMTIADALGNRRNLPK